MQTAKMPMAIRETGKEGLTKFCRDILTLAANLYEDFWWTRMFQSNVVGGIVVKMPKGELGRPDFLCIYRGKPFAIELKSEGGKLSPEQEQMHHRFALASTTMYVPTTPEEIVQVLRYEGLARIKMSYEAVEEINRGE